jgi:hypothetical protein
MRGFHFPVNIRDFPPKDNFIGSKNFSGAGSCENIQHWSPARISMPSLPRVKKEMGKDGPLGSKKEDETQNSQAMLIHAQRCFFQER